jgi:LysM repeat protein
MDRALNWLKSIAVLIVVAIVVSIGMSKIDSFISPVALEQIEVTVPHLPVVAEVVAPAPVVVKLAEVKTVTYVVKKGDSLWKIARKLKGTGTAWGTIWAQNAEKIESPELIYPGQVLTIEVVQTSTTSIDPPNVDPDQGSSHDVNPSTQSSNTIYDAAIANRDWDLTIAVDSPFPLG